MSFKDPKNFIVKLQHLVRKIQNSSDIDIERHSKICQKIISQILKNQTINKLKSNRFRLLAYQMILYCCQDDKKYQNDEYSTLNNNKLVMYLVSIKNLLASIQQLLNNRNIYGEKNQYQNRNTIYHQVMTRFSDGIDKINGFLKQFEPNKQINRNNILQRNSNEKLKLRNIQQANRIQQNQNQLLLQQMQQILIKKQKRITELNNKIKQNLNQINNFSKQCNQLTQTNFKNSQIMKELSTQLSQMKQKNQNLQYDLQLLRQKNRIYERMQNLQKTQKFTPKQNPYQNPFIPNKSSQKHHRRHSNYNSETKKYEQTTSIRYDDSNIHQISLNNQYHSYANGNQHKLIQQQITQKTKNFIKINQKQQINQFSQELYRMILCQASTIEELF